MTGGHRAGGRDVVEVAAKTFGIAGSGGKAAGDARSTDRDGAGSLRVGNGRTVIEAIPDETARAVAEIVRRIRGIPS